MIPRETIEQMLATARQARRHAYMPYSRFPVGAAVLMASGKIYSGANIENASFGLTVCAERVALWSAVAAGERELRAVAVVTANKATPCGACRQVLAEFAPGGAIDDVIVAIASSSETSSDQYQVLRLGDLLPHAFLPRHLDKS